MADEKRTNIYSELFESEKRYVVDLITWVKDFRGAILSCALFTPQKKVKLCDNIFLNMNEILNLHLNILYDMAAMNDECRRNYVQKYCKKYDVSYSKVMSYDKSLFGFKFHGNDLKYVKFEEKLNFLNTIRQKEDINVDHTIKWHYGEKPFDLDLRKKFELAVQDNDDVGWMVFFRNMRQITDKPNVVEIFSESEYEPVCSSASESNIKIQNKSFVDGIQDKKVCDDNSRNIGKSDHELSPERNENDAVHSRASEFSDKKQKESSIDGIQDQKIVHDNCKNLMELVHEKSSKMYANDAIFSSSFESNNKEQKESSIDVNQDKKVDNEDCKNLKKLVHEKSKCDNPNTIDLNKLENISRDNGISHDKSSSISENGDMKENNSALESQSLSKNRECERKKDFHPVETQNQSNDAKEKPSPKKVLFNEEELSEVTTCDRSDIHCTNTPDPYIVNIHSSKPNFYKQIRKNLDFENAATDIPRRFLVSFNFMRSDPYQDIVVESTQDTEVYDSLCYELIYLKHLLLFDCYLEYIYQLPKLEYILEYEIADNPFFEQFVSSFLATKKCQLGYKHFIYRPAQKFTRYPLLFNSLAKVAIDGHKRICSKLFYFFKNRTAIIDERLEYATEQFELYLLFLYTRYATTIIKKIPLLLFMSHRKLLRTSHDILVRSDIHTEPKSFTILVLDHLILITDIIREGLLKKYIVRDAPLPFFKYEIKNNDQQSDSQHFFLQSQYSFRLLERDGNKVFYFYCENEGKLEDLRSSVKFAQDLSSKEFDKRIFLEQVFSADQLHNHENKKRDSDDCDLDPNITKNNASFDNKSFLYDSVNKNAGISVESRTDTHSGNRNFELQNSAEIVNLGANSEFGCVCFCDDEYVGNCYGNNFNNNYRKYVYMTGGEVSEMGGSLRGLFGDRGAACFGFYKEKDPVLFLKNEPIDRASKKWTQRFCKENFENTKENSGSKNKNYSVNGCDLWNEYYDRQQNSKNDVVHKNIREWMDREQRELRRKNAFSQKNFSTELANEDKKSSFNSLATHNHLSLENGKNSTPHNTSISSNKDDSPSYSTSLDSKKNLDALNTYDIEEQTFKSRDSQVSSIVSAFEGLGVESSLKKRENTLLHVKRLSERLNDADILRNMILEGKSSKSADPSTLYSKRNRTDDENNTKSSKNSDTSNMNAALYDKDSFKPGSAASPQKPVKNAVGYADNAERRDKSIIIRSDQLNDPDAMKLVDIGIKLKINNDSTLLKPQSNNTLKQDYLIFYTIKNHGIYMRTPRFRRKIYHNDVKQIKYIPHSRILIFLEKYTVKYAFVDLDTQFLVPFVIDKNVCHFWYAKTYTHELVVLLKKGFQQAAHLYVMQCQQQTFKTLTRIYVGGDVMNIFFMHNLLIACTKQIVLFDLVTLKCCSFLDPLDPMYGVINLDNKNVPILGFFKISSNRFLVCTPVFAYTTNNKGSLDRNCVVIPFYDDPNDFKVFGNVLVKLSSSCCCVYELSAGQIISFLVKKNLKFVESTNMAYVYDDQFVYRIRLPDEYLSNSHVVQE